jgi:hypothetical protein
MPGSIVHNLCCRDEMTQAACLTRSVSDRFTAKDVEKWLTHDIYLSQNQQSHQSDRPKKMRAI